VKRRTESDDMTNKFMPTYVSLAHVCVAAIDVEITAAQARKLELIYGVIDRKREDKSRQDLNFDYGVVWVFDAIEIKSTMARRIRKG